MERLSVLIRLERKCAIFLKTSAKGKESYQSLSYLSDIGFGYSALQVVVVVVSF